MSQECVGRTKVVKIGNLKQEAEDICLNNGETLEDAVTANTTAIAGLGSVNPSQFAQNDTNGVITHTDGDGNAVTANVVSGDGSNANNIISVGPDGGSIIDPVERAQCGGNFADRILGIHSDGSVSSYDASEFFSDTVIGTVVNGDINASSTDLTQAPAVYAATSVGNLITIINPDPCRNIRGTISTSMYVSTSVRNSAGSYNVRLLRSINGGAPVEVGRISEQHVDPALYRRAAEDKFNHEETIGIGPAGTITFQYSSTIEVVESYTGPDNEINGISLRSTYHLSQN